MNQLMQDRAGIQQLRTQMWIVAAAVLVVGLVGTHFLSERSLRRELDAQGSQMQRELTDVRNKLKLLVAAGNDAHAANSLLGELRQQRNQIQEARRSLAEIHALRTQLKAEVDKSAAALASIKQLADVQKSLAEAGRLVAESRKALDGIVALSDRIESEATCVEDADRRLTQLGDLKTRLFTVTSDIGLAEQNANVMIGLKDSLVQRGARGVEAQGNLKSLLQLQDKIAGADKPLTQARDNADKILVLLSDLASNRIDVPAAARNLKQLLEIQKRLNSRGDRIADAVQTLELLSDLQDEIVRYSQSLQGIRKELLELVLLENTVSRVARVLQPLTQLANLRRLGNREVREAARTILDSRKRQYGGNDRPAADRLTPTAARKPIGTLVPRPADID